MHTVVENTLTWKGVHTEGEDSLIGELVRTAGEDSLTGEVVHAEELPWNKAGKRFSAFKLSFTVFRARKDFVLNHRAQEILKGRSL